ncbi:MAG TPA: carbohydrate binding domain-containing protein, partial [Candidatus Methylacidiphilales bacterium]
AAQDMAVTGTGTVTGGAATVNLPARSVSILQTGPNQNLLLNPGFETASLGVNAHTSAWQTWSDGGYDAASYSAPTATAHGGGGQLVHKSAATYNVYTYQDLAGIPNASDYVLTAWVRSGGGQPSCQVQVKVAGQATRTANVAASAGWQQITIPNIAVTNGTCEVGFYSWAYANQWLNVDDVVLSRP